MNASFDIVNFIKNNSLSHLSQDCHNSFINKINENFTETQQRLYISSFYCYLNYNQTTDFIIDLDNVWHWLGFSSKQKAKQLIEKHFIINKDYTLLNQQDKQTIDTRGGHNKQTILLNIRTFKLFCIKAETNKANEIHEYFVKLEDILNEITKDKCYELQQELINSKTTNQLEKELLREKTLLEQFPNNTQCVYYGIIDDKNDDNEKLIKYGNSNNLPKRIETHKKTYKNFRLVNAFKVENKVHIENSIKNNKELIPFKRTLTINNTNYTELLCIDSLSFEKLDNIIKNIISNIEYTPENYLKLLIENNKLKDEINLLRQVNLKLTQLKNKDVLKQEYNKIEYTRVKQKSTKIMKQADNFYYVDDNKYEKLIGSRQEVWNSIAYKTSGGLTKSELLVNCNGKIVSSIKSEQNKNNLRDFCKKRIPSHINDSNEK